MRMRQESVVYRAESNKYENALQKLCDEASCRHKWRLCNHPLACPCELLFSSVYFLNLLPASNFFLIFHNMNIVQTRFYAFHLVLS